MERRAAVACLLLSALVLAGCGTSSPATTAVPQATNPAVVDASAASGPTPVPGAVTAPPVGGGPLDLTALNIDFEPKTLVAPSGPFMLAFRNRDDGVPHTVAINDAGGTQVFTGDIVTGPADVDYAVPQLPPGSYTFTCTVHPNMTGTLTVVP
jgi:plastocyanin